MNIIGLILIGVAVYLFRTVLVVFTTKIIGGESGNPKHV